jgi:hypothetical protein
MLIAEGVNDFDSEAIEADRRGFPHAGDSCLNQRFNGYANTVGEKFTGFKPVVSMCDTRPEDDWGR